MNIEFALEEWGKWARSGEWLRSLFYKPCTTEGEVTSKSHGDGDNIHAEKVEKAVCSMVRQGHLDRAKVLRCRYVWLMSDRKIARVCGMSRRNIPDVLSLAEATVAGAFLNE